MGTIEKIKSKVFGFVTEIKSGVKKVIDTVRTFLADKYNDIVFRLDKGYEFSDVTDDNIIKNCGEILSETLGSEPFEQFTSLSSENRYRAIVQISASASEIMGFELNGLEISDLSKGMCGFYSYENNVICIDAEYILSNPMTKDEAKEVICTLFHEIRHAYQHHASRYPTRFGRDKLTATIWRLNFRNYVQFEQNPVRYYNQPLEVDARQFALLIITNISESE